MRLDVLFHAGGRHSQSSLNGGRARFARRQRSSMASLATPRGFHSVTLRPPPVAVTEYVSTMVTTMNSSEQIETLEDALELFDQAAPRGLHAG